MRIVITGGTGQVGRILTRGLRAKGHEVVLVSRHGPVVWDGRTLGPWRAELEGSDAVINLAGRSVNCRYTQANLDEMMRSRVDSTRVVGEAISKATRPPRVWLQMSTATIYAHTYGAPNDEATGVIGGSEPDVPRYWDFSIAIARAWEKTQAEAPTPRTRKVQLRAAMVMSPDQGGVFDMLRRMTRLGLGGSIAGGGQFVSWIHESDFVRAVLFLIEDERQSGVFNLASPNPLPQREFMKHLRAVCRMPVGLPAARWMAEIGAFFLRTDTELILKSRRVVPGRLQQLGFRFDFTRWEDAASELVSRAR